MTATTTTAPLTQERADLLETLQAHRGFLRFTVRGLTDEQARQRTTASALTLGGLVKHVAATERQWADFLVRGAEAMAADEQGEQAWAAGFTLTGDETLADVLAEYDAVAARTDELVRTLPDLDASHALPPAPWFEPGKRYSGRRVLLHLVAELDGRRTMG